MRRTGLLSAVCAAFLATACGGGDQTASENRDAAEPTTASGRAGDANPSGGGALAGNDVQSFIEQAAISNMAEIQLGRLAAERAQSADVKRFGQMMVDEHSKALDRLKQVATTANVQLPTELDDKHRDLQERLSGLQGQEFDREYMEAMVDAHRDVERLLDDRAQDVAATRGTGDRPMGTTGTGSGATTGDAGRSAEDSPATQQASQWAAQTLPNVRTHLERARQLQEKLENAGSDRR